MSISDAKRRASAKWDAANMTTIGCRVRRDQAEKFKAACILRGTTINAVFLSAMHDFMMGDNRAGSTKPGPDD